MNNGRLALLPILLFIIVGCDPEPKTEHGAAAEVTPPASKPAPEETKTTPGKESSPVAATGKTEPSVTAGTASSPPEAAVKDEPPASTTAATIPTSLKHEGYEYSGVEHTTPVDMEMTVSTQPGVITGSETVTFKEFKNGQAVYGVDRTGGLAALGTEEWMVDKDGVYTTKSSVADIDKRMMELPAVPKPGMTWTVHEKVSRPDAQMDMSVNCKIIGEQKIDTKAGSYPAALLVEQDGNGTIRHDKVRTVSQSWYVKGLGLVKANVKYYYPKGRTESVTIQETKSQ